MTLETQTPSADRLKSVSLSSAALGCITGTAALTAAIMSYWIIRAQVPGLLCATADVFACGSAFLMGNTVRLRDLRARIGFSARRKGQMPIETLSMLPPQHIVISRIKVARLGVLAAALLLLGVFLTIASTQENMQSIAVVAIVGLIAGTICYLCGMWSRPID